MAKREALKVHCSMYSTPSVTSCEEELKDATRCRLAGVQMCGRTGSHELRAKLSRDPFASAPKTLCGSDIEQSFLYHVAHVSVLFPQNWKRMMLEKGVVYRDKLVLCLLDGRLEMFYIGVCVFGIHFVKM